jgi:fermentation-respiration switch protein FrsA (DUF1100 family)
VNNAPATTETRNFSRVAWRVVRRLTIVYLAIVVGMMFLETWLVYPIPPLSRHNWKPTNFSYENAEFTSADGTKLLGWYFPTAGTKRAVLYSHGNGEDVAANGEFISFLSQSLHANVLIYDYRGYGHSQGSPTEAGCIADGDAAQRWLADRVGVPTNSVILIGRSLGTGVSVALAAQNGCRALILENAFPSMVSIAAHQYPWLPVRWIMRNRYDNLSRMKHYTGPLWQSHGCSDTLIPIAAARSLFDASPSQNKKWFEYPHCGHNDARPGIYYDELAAFLDTLDGSGPTADALHK